MGMSLCLFIAISCCSLNVKACHFKVQREHYQIMNWLVTEVTHLDHLEIFDQLQVEEIIFEKGDKFRATFYLTSILL